MKNLYISLFIVATFSLTGYSQSQHSRFDVNGDGELTVSDVSAIYDHLLGILPSINGHAYVDLGLPSGTLWATMNVGANSPEEYGDFFAWGETAPKDVYDWSTYLWCNGSNNTLTKYCYKEDYGYNGFVDNVKLLYPEDDAATANWGPGWYMPTYAQIKELTSKCSTEWTAINGVYGQLFTSRINGETVFFPAAGYHTDIWYQAGVNGYYWSGEVGGTPYIAYILDVDADGGRWGNAHRSNGYSVRPVSTPQE